jgi:hypothetical protein
MAFRRLKDGTPLLYAFRERMAASGVQPPFDVYGLAENPFALVPRHKGSKLPAPLLDQTDAAIGAGRLFVTSRFTREVLEMRFEDDLPAKEGVRRASYLRLTDELLGLKNVAQPLFGNVEGVAVDWNMDLFLLVDNNREIMGVRGRNEGCEGRLLWFRCKGKAPPREPAARWRVCRLVVPESEGARGRALELLRRAREGIPLEQLADEAGLEPPSWRSVARADARLLPGEVNLVHLPAAFRRLVENLDVGDIELCEYDPEESPEGWLIVWRAQ